MTKSTINKDEVNKFSKISQEWWDENGKFKPLHKFNPIRIALIKNKLIQHFGLDENSKTPLKKLKIADIGCGGGLLCEPLSKVGAKLTGIDASKENIEVAKIHAQKSKLDINYHNIELDQLIEKKEKFDVVLAMEVVEHVDNVEYFISSLEKILKKDGLIFIATLNKTAKSYLKAIIGAEYILRWLPKGTHDWNKFLKPSQIHEIISKNNPDLKLLESKGFDYNILNDSWKITDNLDVNYVMIFAR